MNSKSRATLEQVIQDILFRVQDFNAESSPDAADALDALVYIEMVLQDAGLPTERPESK